MFVLSPLILLLLHICPATGSGMSKASTLLKGFVVVVVVVVVFIINE